jgi:acetyl-CoA carboxylase biotin carboxylase subunit
MEKLLVANRGEIAVRVIRAAKTLGIETVAVHSQQDKDSLHINKADYAINLGPGPASENYLNQQKIIDFANKFEVDAIHPGYGFLSENADFAKLVIDTGIKWVGPPVETIRQLGDKLTSRIAAEKAGVPTTKGSDENVQPDEDAKKIAKDIGYPIIVKALFGGGGMGIEVVGREEDLISSIQRTQKQAKAAFGRDEVFIEKFIEKPRHIEIQFIADTKGNVIHLGERECSIQRRHQKLIEEAPSVAITEDQRNEIGEAVKRLARSVGYVNAGTAEFLYQDGSFYFNEVNTRLQVEHPVTEMITGKDIVCEQLQIANGSRLSWKQEDIKFQGHAIELRINSEDPINDFVPVVGTVDKLSIPGGPGVRFDSHLYQGYTIPRDYDSLLGKLIIWGEDRKQAISRAYLALTELSIIGVPTNQPFHLVTLANKSFHEGNISTHFIDDNNIIRYIRVAYARRIAALFASQYYTRKVFLPARKEHNWRLEAIRESAGRW